MTCSHSAGDLINKINVIAGQKMMSQHLVENDEVTGFVISTVCWLQISELMLIKYMISKESKISSQMTKYDICAYLFHFKCLRMILTFSATH